MGLGIENLLWCILRQVSLYPKKIFCAKEETIFVQVAACKFFCLSNWHNTLMHYFNTLSCKQRSKSTEHDQIIIFVKDAGFLFSQSQVLFNFVIERFLCKNVKFRSHCTHSVFVWNDTISFEQNVKTKMWIQHLVTFVTWITVERVLLLYCRFEYLWFHARCENKTLLVVIEASQNIFCSHGNKLNFSLSVSEWHFNA